MKLCRQCKTRFKPTMSSMQICCSTDCAFAWARTIKGKAHVAKVKRADTRERRLKVKTKSEWTKETQVTFNAFIRERDLHEPCISCGIPANNKINYWDCGHYRSVGSAPELRFNAVNAHKQCKKCNRDLSGNVVEYRLRLIDRIGTRNLNWLEGPHEMPNLIIDDLIKLKAHYKLKKKELENEREYQQKGV